MPHRSNAGRTDSGCACRGAAADLPRSGDRQGTPRAVPTRAAGRYLAPTPERGTALQWAPCPCDPAGERDRRTDAGAWVPGRDPGLARATVIPSTSIGHFGCVPGRSRHDLPPVAPRLGAPQMACHIKHLRRQSTPPAAPGHADEAGCTLGRGPATNRHVDGGSSSKSGFAAFFMLHSGFCRAHRALV